MIKPNKYQKTEADWGTAERWQHAGRLLAVTEKGGVPAARVLEEHPLDVLVQAGDLAEALSLAAWRFKRDFLAARLEAHLAASYAPRTGGSFFAGQCERTEAEEEAYTRWRLAMRAMGAPYHNVVLTAVCHDKTPPKAVIPYVRVGLERLDKWYKTERETAALRYGLPRN